MAGHRHVDHPVARVEAAETAGARVEPFLQRGIERAGAGRAAVARGDHLGLPPAHAERPRHGVGDELDRTVHRLARVVHRDDHDLLVRGVHRGSSPSPTQDMSSPIGPGSGYGR